MNVNGSKWIRPAKRNKIYDRDGWRCLWCGRQVIRSRRKAYNQATLDHFMPRSFGLCNHETNLLTACYECNTMRGEMRPTAWADDLAAKLGQSAEGILWRVLRALERPLGDKT